MPRRLLVVPALVLVAVAFVAWSPGPPARAEQAAAGSSPFKNLEILTHVTSKTEMRQIMREQAAALGVKCTHCHVPGKFDLDEKAPKRAARDMMRLVAQLNATAFPEAEKKPAITCWTCHRGSLEPETAVPRSAFDTLDAQQ